MNQTRIVASMMAILFLLSLGVGLMLGRDDGAPSPSMDDPLTAAVVGTSTTTTTEPSTTTTTSSTTTTTTTTAPRTPPTAPPTTPPPTVPPSTAPTTPPTTALPYDPILCAAINTFYAISEGSDDDRIAHLQAVDCPPHFW